MTVISKIITSQKAIMTMVGSIALAFGASEGLNEVILQGITALFGLLITVQGALDYKHGSRSDGTGQFRVE